MSAIVYIAAYLSLLVFASAVIYKVVEYLRRPHHARWELYPVAHEGHRASYGGGYLEETKWWEKTRKRSIVGELKVMIPEILCLKGVWEHNRRLWYVSYPFHLGLYFCVAFIVLIFISALGMTFWLSPDSGLMHVLTAVTNLVGPLGFILSLFGATGLFVRRLTDPDLKPYSAFSHYFNLVLFISLMSVSILAWLFVDPSFNITRKIAFDMLNFSFESIGSSLVILQWILGAFVIAYIPLTHMSHLFMKYFLYHEIRWGDTPAVDDPGIDSRIATVLNYPVTWSAPHIAGFGKSTWAWVATFNPATAEKEKEA